MTDTTKPKVIITGASGLLGRAVFNCFQNAGFDVIGTAFSRSGEKLVKLNLTDFDAVKQFIAKEKPATIIHCAAERRPDVAAKDTEGARKLNIAATENIAQAAKEAGSWLVYISTDYVFDGNNPPYEVDAKVNPLNFYGQTKYEGEVTLSKTYPEAAILRVPILYGPTEYDSESAVNILLEIIKNTAKTVDMDDFQARYPTNVEDIAKVLRQMTERAVFKKEALSGVFHYSAPEKMTKYQICAVFANILSLPIDHLKPIREAPKEPVATRPNDAHLATTRLETLGFDLTAVKFEDWFRTYLRQ
ncbi:uncharacterized protein EV422DRAFT_523923 [Fimicolochytrium jonesii]|uniref:uncharacterized protein n=1 Tax=Fimicolochytrium jonesii TaxID=1396493 RepID=UPI0022FE43B7|nr:uncharacterized protein EV422DRAFT_523923 [Fimicolochytrium jonesii]KAI8822412.1 hypothetical protein EV422DRAFT_523923 [Fimicolochytrium jonesii]